MACQGSNVSSPDLIIMIVDDEPDILAELMEFIYLSDINAVAAPSAQIALEYVVKSPSIKIVLADYNMPKMDGLEFVEEIQKRFIERDISVVSITGHLSEEAMVNYKEKKNVKEILYKPIDIERLIEIVKYIPWSPAK